MDVADRRRLLAIAAEEGILLLEDNPYGLFPHADEQRQPTLKALDEQRTVVYLGSFAKTAMPGVRVGYLVADQLVTDSAGGRSLLADQLSKLKSMLTVNTSPITQAIVGGKLLDNDCSLLRANEREREVYTRNMRQMVAGLAARFGDPDLGVRWNVPIGGFFVVVTVPFVVDDALLERSAADYGVLWTSMHHFYEPGVPVHALRLSCSTVTADQIELGLDRVASLINDQLAQSQRR
jgi:(S)-3,5-dihydroxyphenylglycine transaminase